MRLVQFAPVDGRQHRAPQGLGTADPRDAGADPAEVGQVLPVDGPVEAVAG